MKRKKQILVGIAVFSAVCSASAFIGWCTGFNFDHRDEEVGFWIAMTLVGGLLFAGIIATELIGSDR